MTDFDIVGRFCEPRVVVLGDLMLDTWIHGHVARISPEAPIPVFRIERRRDMFGGAGNVACNIAALGGTAVLIGVIGADTSGQRLCSLASSGEARSGSIEACFVTSFHVPTIHKTRYVAAGQQLLRVDEEVVRALDEESETGVIERLEDALEHAGAVILSDYAKGCLTPRIVRHVIASSRQKGIPVVVDPKGRDYSRYSGATILTPNRAEAAEATGIECSDDESSERAGQQLLAAAGVDTVLVTRGPDGVTIIGKDGGAHHISTRAKAVFDVSGAGDTLVATLTLALAASQPLLEAAHIANAAAGVVVGKSGTATVSPRELSEALRGDRMDNITRKVVSLEDALDRIGRWRAGGARVGFTNGCFDLVHPGHIRLVSQARSACDRLVVGLNADSSVTKLKGPKRPVQSETARATVLASIESVDLVVLFADDTPIRLIEAIRPDVLIKGADYSAEEVVGAPFVRSYGGRLHLVPIESGQSTTGTISRISAAAEPSV